MRKFMPIFAVVAAAMVAPTFAHAASTHSGPSAAADRNQQNVVMYAGKIIGQDPDANVRLSLLRDAEAPI